MNWKKADIVKWPESKGEKIGPDQLIQKNPMDINCPTFKIKVMIKV